MPHLALDRFRGMGPRTFMMRVVIRPQEVVDQVELESESETGAILLKGHCPMLAKILAGQLLELGIRPHVVLAIALVHRIKRPRHPPDPGLDRRKFEPREFLKHSGGAQRGYRLDR